MRNYVLVYAAMIAVASLFLLSCGASKPVLVTAINEEVTIKVPCEDFKTDANFFRGQGVGQSKDLNTAREKARMAANIALAGSIQTWVKQFSERYVNDAGQSPADYSETFESLTQQKIDKQISNISTACSETVRTRDGMYKVYLALEADRKEAFEALDNALAADKKISTIYDREKFRKLYNAEMDSFKKQY